MDKIESKRKLCLKHQTELRSIMLGFDQYELAIDLFFSQHATLHSAKMSGAETWSFEDEILDDITPEQVRRIPDNTDQSAEQCIFLHNNECTIYPVRPVICRTHGLPIIYPDRQGIDICPLNFTEFDLTKIDNRFLFDAERITENLMRLNLEFCIMTEKKDSAGDRIPLHRLMNRDYKSLKDFCSLPFT